jgi:hypothetical protein
MPKTITIDLVDPREAHGEMLRQAIIREPGGADYFALGDPFVIARNPDGTLFEVVNEQVVRGYIERLAEKPNASVLMMCGLADAMRIRQAIIDFFYAERAKTSPAPQTSSSST